MDAPPNPGTGSRHQKGMELLGTTLAGVGVDVSEGTDEGFTAFYSATWPRMYRTAYAIARDPGAAEDALQSAYAKAYAVWGRVVRADRPEAYLRRMVVNEVLGARRSAARRPEHLTGAPEAWETGGEVPAERHAERDELWTALGRLAPRQRAVLVLRYYEDLSEADIAAALGCSRGTVKSQASAALATLRRTTGRSTGPTDGTEA